MAFSVGQKIVVPYHGVCSVVQIKKEKFKDKVMNAYELYSDREQMDIKLPEASVDQVGIRTLSSKSEVMAGIDILSGKTKVESYGDWKLRQSKFSAFAKEASVKSLCILVKSMYPRAKKKDLPSTERRIFDSAFDTIVDEFAIVLGKTTQESQSMIEKSLEG